MQWNDIAVGRMLGMERQNGAMYHWYDKKVVHRQKRCGAYFGRYYANEVRL